MKFRFVGAGRFGDRLVEKPIDLLRRDQFEEREQCAALPTKNLPHTRLFNL
jgi:hypothetical protein